MSGKSKPKINYFHFLCFFLPIMYWTYLFFTSRPEIVHDSVGYELLGKRIIEDGWRYYFTSGPTREPVYPLLVASAVRLSKFFSFSYIQPLKILQLLLLLLTQLLSLRILQKAGVKPLITGLTVFYMGISPALVNSALSVYSEIASYASILGIILLTTAFWNERSTLRVRKAFLLGALSAFFFLVLTLTKGVYEFIFYIYLLPFLFLVIVSRDNKRCLDRLAVFLFTFVTLFQTGVISYKFLNYEHNNHFTLTDRASWALYGSIARRVEKLTPQRLLTAIAYIPGEGFCNGVFGEEACYFWGIETLDDLALTKFAQVKSAYPAAKIDAIMKRDSFAKLKENPLQFFLLMPIDALKMFFWETTQMGFVTYPPRLHKLFTYTPFKNGIRLIVSLLTLFATLYLIVIVLRNWRDIFTCEPANPTVCLDFFILLICCSHVGLYALFDTIPRFALPIAPLFLLVIALSADNLWSRK